MDTETKQSEQYIQAVGRRKTSTAIARLTKAPKTSYCINNKSLTDYFPTQALQSMVSSAFAVAPGNFSVNILVHGGGITSQAGAVRHAISRALLKNDPEQRSVLKAAGFLMRDPRAKERRKFGLKKARKAPQWSKR